MDALNETVSTEADELWLLNADIHNAHYSIEVSPGSTGEVSVLKPGELLEHNLSTAGRLRVPVEIPALNPGKGDTEFYRMRVKGNAQVLWLEKNGRIASGNDILIRDSGVLWLQHQPGTLVAWLENPPRQQGNQVVAEWMVLQSPRYIFLKG